MPQLCPAAGAGQDVAVRVGGVRVQCWGEVVLQHMRGMPPVDAGASAEAAIFIGVRGAHRILQTPPGSPAHFYLVVPGAADAPDRIHGPVFRITLDLPALDRRSCLDDK